VVINKNGAHLCRILAERMRLDTVRESLEAASRVVKDSFEEVSRREDEVSRAEEEIVARLSLGSGSPLHRPSPSLVSRSSSRVCGGEGCYILFCFCFFCLFFLLSEPDNQRGLTTRR
jgi:hypothetical protein